MKLIKDKFGFEWYVDYELIPATELFAFDRCDVSIKNGVVEFKSEIKIKK